MIKLNNKWWTFLIIIILVGLCFGIFLLTKNKKNEPVENYSANRTSLEFSEENIEQNNKLNNITNNSENENNIAENNQINITTEQTEQPKEETISSFSTKIYTHEKARQNNVTITCSKLNETVIPNGQTFSFCNTVGKATKEQGYQEADIFDKDGNKKKGLGGGNCQVSTTLYNAVLSVPSLEVVERHKHSNKVPYIQTGKDAAVAYGSYDFKFKNNTGFDIKILASNTENSVDIRLIKQ